MMSLKVYGSSSKGNCYLFSTSTTNILLDCGVKNIEEKIDLKNLDGILLTHRHL